MLVKTLILVAFIAGSLGFPSDKLSAPGSEGVPYSDPDGLFGNIVNGIIGLITGKGIDGDVRALDEEKLKLTLGPIALEFGKGTRAERKERFLGVISNILQALLKEGETRSVAELGPLGAELAKGTPAEQRQRFLGFITGILGSLLG